MNADFWQADFWKDKTVLVTGHTGFKGGWLCLWLQHMGARVVGYGLEAPTQPNFYEAVGLSESIESHHGNILDWECLQQVFQQTRPDLVFHLAAQSLVLKSYQNPVETYQTNVMGTVNLLEACRQTPSVRVVVNVTSDKCYEDRNDLSDGHQGHTEGDALGGNDPYSNSKACAELVTSAYRTSYFKHSHCAIATVRSGNVIGGGDWADDRLIPDIIRALMKNGVVTLRSPQAIRPWQHVLDPLHGYLMLAQALWSGNETYRSSWNFGPSAQNPVNALRLTHGIIKRWFPDGPPRGSVEEHLRTAAQASLNAPHQEIAILCLDAGKARQHLHWWPLLNTDITLDWLIEWYQAYVNQLYDAQDGVHSEQSDAEHTPLLRNLSLTQIVRFERLRMEATVPFMPIGKQPSRSRGNHE